jgi:hypothetical protein
MRQVSVGLLLLLVALGPLGGPAVAQAQGPGLVPDENVVSPTRNRPRTYGTQDVTSHTVGAFGFTGADAASSALFATNGFASRFCSGAPCVFQAPVFLPAGVLVGTIELDACDTSASAGVTARLFRVPDLEAGNVELVSVSTGAAETPGCAFFFQDLPNTEQIDNFNNNYLLQVSISGTDSTTRFWGVRVYYVLQISPPPATPTFDDVPATHPFFVFIEALAAAGITSGCSANPPLYCPENFITRGEAAVFFSRSLGLHFEP